MLYRTSESQILYSGTPNLELLNSSAPAPTQKSKELDRGRKPAILLESVARCLSILCRRYDNNAITEFQGKLELTFYL